MLIHNNGTSFKKYHKYGMGCNQGVTTSPLLLSVRIQAETEGYLHFITIHEQSYMIHMYASSGLPFFVKQISSKQNFKNSSYWSRTKASHCACEGHQHKPPWDPSQSNR